MILIIAKNPAEQNNQKGTKNMEERPGYYAIIPANVRYDKRLKPIERLLYGEITALSNKEGFCFATNGYFAGLYECTKISISNYVRHLEECGYIKTEYDDGNNRKIFITEGIKSSEGGIKNSFNTLLKENLRPIKNSFNNNNTSNNTTNNYEKKESETEKNDFDEISKEYDKRYPMTLSSYKSQQLADILANYGKEATLFAIRESLSANAKKPIEYIRSVAMNNARDIENKKEVLPKKGEDLETIGKRIKEETEKARAEGKSMTPQEMKQKVIEEMKRKGMKIVGNSTPA